LNQVLELLENHFDNFRITDALLVSYKLVWDDFCAWYLEMVKPAYGQPMSSGIYKATIDFLEKILKILHPFMPFLTEEVWHKTQKRVAEDCITVANWPIKKSYAKDLLEEASLAFALISQARHAKVNAQLPAKQRLVLYVLPTMPDWLAKFEEAIVKLAFIDKIILAEQLPQEAISFTIQGYTFFILLQQALDVAQEKERLTKELAYYQGFLETVNKKLHNVHFLQKAPQHILAVEYNKQKDATVQITLLQERLAQLQ
jgi:valyl-tRNA synthetase